MYENKVHEFFYRKKIVKRKKNMKNKIRLTYG